MTNSITINVDPSSTVQRMPSGLDPNQGERLNAEFETAQKAYQLAGLKHAAYNILANLVPLIEDQGNPDAATEQVILQANMNQSTLGFGSRVVGYQMAERTCWFREGVGFTTRGEVIIAYLLDDTRTPRIHSIEDMSEEQLQTLIQLVYDVSTPPERPVRKRKPRKYARTARVVAE